MDKHKGYEFSPFESLQLSEWPANQFSGIKPNQLSKTEQQAIVKLAVEIILGNFQRGNKLSSPEDVIDELRVLLAWQKEEVFSMLFLDNQHRVLSFEKLFHGTINSASVYPRVIVRRAIELNAAAWILAHNHPSGTVRPSDNDHAITQRIVSSLKLIDVRVLDHIVVGQEDAISFAQQGLMPNS